MSVNTRIRQIREEKKLLRREVADKLGISDVAYGKLENEKTKVKVDTLKKIAEILDEPLEKFFQEGKECNIIQHNQNTEQINQIQINETDAKKIEELYINLIQSKDNEIAMLKMLLVSKDEKVAVLEREI
jgi:transcriptional regulator with XRE-family HTH domain